MNATLPAYRRRLNARVATVTLEQLIRHAQLFGTELVVETAVELGLPPAQVARRRIECDAIEANQHAKLEKKFKEALMRGRPHMTRIRSGGRVRLRSLYISREAHRVSVPSSTDVHRTFRGTRIARLNLRLRLCVSSPR
jgi:hypothetical protein